MNSHQIQEMLFKKYYSEDNFSKNTSSHWGSFGEKNKVIKKNDSFKFSASGISNFSKKSFLRTFKHLFIKFLLFKMLKKYRANNETIQATKSIIDQANIFFEFDHAKHILIYDLLDSYGLFSTEDLICIIVDGHGFFGTLIKTLNPHSKIIFINFGKNLLIDTACFSANSPDLDLLLLNTRKNKC